ncbi:MAG: restriction endonuclease [Lachnospiraceae bacterium]|nr:restriction endonuclease [Lachnospiraceae bacterium]
MNDKIQTTWLLIVALGICFCIGFILLTRHLIRQYRRSRRAGMIDEMEGHDFEYFCAELLEKRGFMDVEVTRGSGDYGVDILAEKEGVTYAIQCKRYSAPVGVEAVQQIYAGRDYYDRMVGAVITNQYFTAAAVEAAKRLKILLWDRGYLDSMIEEGEKNSFERMS